MNGVVHAPFPNPYRPVLERNAGEDYGETVVRYIDDQILGHILPPDEVAGILVETIQGEGGYIVPPPGFFPALRKLCDKHGILLIVDEVQSGMGRTGKWWAIEHFGVEPDIVTAAKGIASGMPLGACIARQSVMDWERGSHGNTYGGNPLACAAALATFDLIQDEYLANAAEVGQYTIDALEEIQARHPSIGDVRGRGLMIGVEFVQDRKTKVPAKELCDRIVELAFERGLLTLGCGKSVIRVAPALSIKKSEIDEGLQTFEEAVTLAEKEFNLQVAA
jgi:4-aminobutyrate aminotransferase